MVPALAVKLGPRTKKLPAVVFGQIAGAAADQAVAEMMKKLWLSNTGNENSRSPRKSGCKRSARRHDDQGVDEAGTDEAVRVEGRQDEARVEIRRFLERQVIEDPDQTRRRRPGL